MIKYLVTCYHCRVKFNALGCIWCNCIADEPTIVCPGCLNCLCKAPADYVRRFWSGAPQTLWNMLSFTARRHFTPPANPKVTKVKRPLILIVDPNKRSLCMAFQAIRGLEYGTILAHNGYEGFELATSYRPELIITETLMPRLDGREMCRLLKRDPETAQIKVLIATSLYASNENREEAFESFHVDDYLIKPISFPELHNALLKHMRHDPGGYQKHQTASAASY